MPVLSKRSVTIGASVYFEQAEAMRASAAANERSFSAEIRRAINVYLASEAEIAKKMSPAAGDTAPGSAIAGQSDAFVGQ